MAVSPTNKDAFLKQIKDFEDRIPEEVTGRQRRMARVALRVAVARSPRKSGQLQESWKITLTKATKSTSRTKDPVSKGDTRIAKVKRPYKKIILSNATRHANFRETGTVHNLPNAMVAMAMIAANKSFE